MSERGELGETIGKVLYDYREGKYQGDTPLQDAVKKIMRSAATHHVRQTLTELQALRDKSRSFNGYLKTDGLSVEAIPLEALDEVISKYGSEGTG